MNKYKTYNVTPKDVVKKWYIIDADGKSLGKVAAKASYILRGKHKAIYTPYLDTGDNVIIINASKAVMTGNKYSDKIYYHHTGHPGGMKSFTYDKLVERKPIYPMEIAVKGMLPKGPLGRDLFRNLRIFKDDKYTQVSQNPVVVEKL
ncbi:MAG TPA: 50S ribosomal protein L13 [Spirochaetota bacterium]|nr:50S ribosomal protein L13 [Spirochaetota bacterium]